MSHQLQNATSHNTWVRQYGTIAYICFTVLTVSLAIGYIQQPPVDPQTWQDLLPSHPLLAVLCMTSVGLGTVLSFLCYLHCLGVLKNERIEGITAIFVYPLVPIWTVISALFLALIVYKLCLFIYSLNWSAIWDAICDLGSYIVDVINAKLAEADQPKETLNTKG